MCYCCYMTNGAYLTSTMLVSVPQVCSHVACSRLSNANFIHDQACPSHVPCRNTSKRLVERVRTAIWGIYVQQFSLIHILPNACHGVLSGWSVMIKYLSVLSCHEADRRIAQPSLAPRPSLCFHVLFSDTKGIRKSMACLSELALLMVFGRIDMRV
ncbi:hypothetical protein DFH29DRAFT_518313 [Suillus ampliporus]|nr:hypothetical protein DFH29DRAFT_518313 [Suillus ampliporus]